MWVRCDIDKQYTESKKVWIEGKHKNSEVLWVNHD